MTLIHILICHCGRQFEMPRNHDIKNNIRRKCQKCGDDLVHALKYFAYADKEGAWNKEALYHDSRAKEIDALYKRWLTEDRKHYEQET